MLTGLYDYKELADDFLRFVTGIQEKKIVSKDDKTKLLEFAEQFKSNQCYKLKDIRDKAAKSGQDIIGIPVNITTKQRIVKPNETNAIMEAKQVTVKKERKTKVGKAPTSESKPNPVSPNDLFIERPSAPAGAQRLGSSSNEVGDVATKLEFDALGNVVTGL